MEDKYVIHSYFVDEKGNRKSEEFTLSLSEWAILQDKHPLWNRFKDNMGIGGGSMWYFELNQDQNIQTEFINTHNFIGEYMQKYATDRNLDPNKMSCQFINYGKTQLVYVMTDENNTRHTLLVKQPATPYGAVKKEADILTELQGHEPNVIAPIEYYSNGQQELYVTPYLQQARCIASDDKWGVYVPEPIYRFEHFSKEEADIINSCMIAKLISFYDTENNQGLSSCKLGGGDFILAKGYEQKAPTIDWIMQNLYLIAGRDKISCSFDEYCNIIRDEFSRRTIDEKTPPTINVRGRVPMTTFQIEKGISLGKSLLANKQPTNQTDTPTM